MIIDSHMVVILHLGLNTFHSGGENGIFAIARDEVEECKRNLQRWRIAGEHFYMISTLQYDCHLLVQVEIHNCGSWLHGTTVASSIYKLKSCANLYVTGSVYFFRYATTISKSPTDLGYQGQLVQYELQATYAYIRMMCLSCNSRL